MAPAWRQTPRDMRVGPGIHVVCRKMGSSIDSTSSMFPAIFAASMRTARKATIMRVGSCSGR